MPFHFWGDGPFVMNFWMFAFLCVLVGSYFEYRKTEAKTRMKREHSETGAILKELEGIRRLEALEDASARKDPAALRQRVEVLERIVTDRGYQLEDEFSRLDR